MYLEWAPIEVFTEKAAPVPVKEAKPVKEEPKKGTKNFHRIFQPFSCRGSCCPNGRGRYLKYYALCQEYKL
jgi:hypothetical protein